MRFRAALALGLACAACVAVAAMQVRIDAVAVSQAISIGQSRVERDLSRFHQAYRLVVNRAPVDHVEVVTPFRQVVLAAQARAQIGDRSFGQRQGLDLARAIADLLEIRVELTFHPLHTYVGVPDYKIALIDRRGARLLPLVVERHPRFGPRVEGLPLPLPGPGGTSIPGGGEPMLGGAVVARFDIRALNAEATYELIVEESGKELARTRADLAKMR